MSSELNLDRTHFAIRYKVNGSWTSTYHVADAHSSQLPAFNEAAAPFLFASGTEELNFDVLVEWSDSTGSQAFWSVEVKMFHKNSTVPIKTSLGAESAVAFVNLPVASGHAAPAGVIPILAGDGWVFQGPDFELGAPVRMQVTALAFSDAAHTHKIAVADPEASRYDFWLMRV